MTRDAGPVTETANHHRTNSLRLQDQAADGGQSNGDRGQGASSPAAMRYAFHAVHAAMWAAARTLNEDPIATLVAMRNYLVAADLAMGGTGRPQ